jgi:hypothetical protein
MNYYEQILAQIESKAFTNLEIALMAISYWIIEAPGMTDTNLADIMTKLNYTFDITNKTLNDGTNTLTVYDMLYHAIETIYTTSNLTAAALKLVIRKVYSKNYITSDQKSTLLNNLSTATSEA